MPQVASPSVPSDLATIAERYDALVARGAIERDRAQVRVVAVLDALAHRLTDIKQTRFGLTKLLDQGDISDEKGRGIYISGGVGRGKTMLMDLFFKSVQNASVGYIFTSSWWMCTTAFGKLARRWNIAV